MCLTYNGQSYESYHQNTFKNHYYASQKENQTRNKEEQCGFVEEITERALEVQEDVGIRKNTTCRDNDTNNAVENR